MTSRENPLPDYLQEGLDVIFVGYNPGTRSGETGHHYAGHTNLFWRLLHDAGFTDRELNPEEDSCLLEYGYGLTNISPQTTPSSADLSWDELLEGGRKLGVKLACYRPKLTALLGKGVYRAYAQLSRSSRVEWGWQPAQQVQGVIDFVAPNPSGRSTVPYARRLELFQQLREITDQLTKGAQ